MEKFHLNNSVQDPTFMTELICGELFRQAGVPAPRVNPCARRAQRQGCGALRPGRGFRQAIPAQAFCKR
jgi:hypothetical protein